MAQCHTCSAMLEDSQAHLKKGEIYTFFMSYFFNFAATFLACKSATLQNVMLNDQQVVAAGETNDACNNTWSCPWSERKGSKGRFAIALQLLSTCNVNGSSAAGSYNLVCAI